MRPEIKLHADASVIQLSLMIELGIERNRACGVVAERIGMAMRAILGVIPTEELRATIGVIPKLYLRAKRPVMSMTPLRARVRVMPIKALRAIGLVIPTD